MYAISLSLDFITLSKSITGDVESRKAITTWTLGTGVENQQVGNTWTAGDDIVSLSMSGDVNVFDKRVGDKPARVLLVSIIVFSNMQTDPLMTQLIGPI